MQEENKHKYDLEERTAVFGESVIELARKFKLDAVNKPLISQIVRSSTSVGANYTEADGGVSKKDFRNKIGTCRKEAKETKHWLRMLSKANPEHIEGCRVIWKEAHELVLIFSKIYNNSKDKD